MVLLSFGRCFFLLHAALADPNPDSCLNALKTGPEKGRARKKTSNSFDYVNVYLVVTTAGADLESLFGFFFSCETVKNLKFCNSEKSSDKNNLLKF